MLKRDKRHVNSPLMYIVAGTIIALWLIFVGKLLSNSQAQPAIWWLLLASIGLAIFALAISTLFSTRKINSGFQFLPPPFNN